MIWSTLPRVKVDFCSPNRYAPTLPSRHRELMVYQHTRIGTHVILTHVEQFSICTLMNLQAFIVHVDGRRKKVVTTPSSAKTATGK
ncbi:hypothetical protein AVEN_79425-1, partial [Araneus ventricosus]